MNDVPSRVMFHEARKLEDCAKLSQKEKFIAAAKEFEADETGKTFLRSVKKIAEHAPVRRKGAK